MAAPQPGAPCLSEVVALKQRGEALPNGGRQPITLDHLPGRRWNNAAFGLGRVKKKQIAGARWGRHDTIADVAPFKQKSRTAQCLWVGMDKAWPSTGEFNQLPLAIEIVSVVNGDCCPVTAEQHSAQRYRKAWAAKLAKTAQRDACKRGHQNGG
jgi:hypothetical protein